MSGQKYSNGVTEEIGLLLCGSIVLLVFVEHSFVSRT